MGFHYILNPPRKNSNIAQPNENSYFAQDHSRLVSIPTLCRIYVCAYIGRSIFQDLAHFIVIYNLLPGIFNLNIVAELVL